MDKSKKSINKRIFFSHMLIISICVILTLIVFIACFKIFIRKETRAELVAANKILNKSITQNLKNNIGSSDINDVQVIKNTLKIENSLKQIQSYSTINYVLIDGDKNIISPQQNKGEASFIKNKLIPSINGKKLKKSNLKNNALFSVIIAGKNYEMIISSVKSIHGINKKLVIYSDLSQSNNLTNIVIIMLIIILFVTALIASIISNKVSTKISYPIYKLIAYAKKIGKREYDADFEKYDDDDEIGELASTMNSMAQSLCAYDTTIKTFLQNASHELRTPLMSIQGYAEGIKFGVVDEQEKAIDIIIEESKRLSELVDALLYLSKIDGMQDDFKNEEIDVANLIGRSIERVSGIAVKNRKTITFINEKKEGLFIVGDNEKLVRALINILGNCLRYCNKEVIVLLNDNIEISDDGAGFDKDDIAHVFDRFYKGKDGNHGLGLAITRSIIERHGGTVTAKNKNGGGACFIISLGK